MLEIGFSAYTLCRFLMDRDHEYMRKVVPTPAEQRERQDSRLADRRRADGRHTVTMVQW